MTPEEFADEISDIVDKAIEKLKQSASKSQKSIFDKVSEFAKEFETTAEGAIKPTAVNLKKLQSIRNKLGKTVANDEWVKAVKTFTNELKVLELRVKTFMLAEHGNEFNFDKPVFAAIKENSILLTRQSLLESGLSEKVTTQIEPILARAVTLGTPYRDMIQGTRELLLENDGKLVRWVKQIAADQQHQYVRNFMQTASQGLTSEWYFYSGGRVRETRQFCSDRLGKYWHISEIHSWANLTWNGKNPNTTVDNILTLLGGYGCLHLLVQVSESQVPKERLEQFSKAA